MIARIWRGATRPEKADSYLDYLSRTGIPDYERTAGNLGAFVMRNVDNGLTHFLTLSFWDSYDAVKRFAGSNYELSKHCPEDADYLIDDESNVQHFEVFGPIGTPSYVRNYANSRLLPRWW